MCLIAFAIGASARWPLVVAANRDEFFDRPAAPLAAWTSPGGQEIMSGRDLRAGGTWLGMTPGGRIAFLTNVREAVAPASLRSRGELVMRWLEGQQGAADSEEFVHALRKNASAYGGFNLVLGDFQQSAWTWLSNKPGAATGETALHSQTLTQGIYGLSNASLDTPWPKTVALKCALAAALAAPTLDALEYSLRHALDKRQRADGADLPQTGVPFALEQALSSAFVDMADRGYGTRCSSLLVATALDPGGATGRPGWRVTLEERTHQHGAQVSHAGESGTRRCQVNWTSIAEI